jgi:hypothetical protein
MSFIGQEKTQTVFDRFGTWAKRAAAGATKATAPTTTGWMRWMPWVLGGTFVVMMFGGRRRR